MGQATRRSQLTPPYGKSRWPAKARQGILYPYKLVKVVKTHWLQQTKFEGRSTPEDRRVEWRKDRDSNETAIGTAIGTESASDYNPESDGTESDETESDETDSDGTESDETESDETDSNETDSNKTDSDETDSDENE